MLAKVVYATMTGNTEEITDYLVEEFENQGVEVEKIEADDAEEDVFDDADIAVVATYTYGQGEVPDDFEDFIEDLADQDLAGKIYGVVGSGGKTKHAKTFAFAVDTFNDAFAKTGAKKGHEGVKIDEAPDDDDKVLLKEFVESLVKA